MLQKIAFISIILISLTSCKSRWLVGSWEGLGQENEGTTWSVNLDANTKDEVNISYPGIEVMTKWEILFEKNDQIAYLEYNYFGSENDKQVYTVLVNRISDDILEIKYYAFDPYAISFYSMFSADKLMAKAMVKRRIGIGNMCKTVGTPRNFEFTPQPLKVEKAAKYKPEHP